jgi:hypothetical protein
MNLFRKRASPYGRLRDHQWRNPFVEDGIEVADAIVVR